MVRSHRFGQLAEELVAEFLTGRGWRIVDRNWRFHHKEIDIIARRGPVVAFVEVKARGEGGWGHPLEAITGSKRRELAVAARAWVAANGRRNETYRFDAAIVLRTRGKVTVEHYEDAWRL